MPFGSLKIVMPWIETLSFGTEGRGVKSEFSQPANVVVVVLLFYVHGKHLRSCRDGQLT